MLRRLMLLAALCTAAPALHAQHAVTTPLPDPPHPGVTFTVTGYVVPSPTGEPPLPMELLERLSTQSSLAALETGPTPAGRAMLQIRFVFADLDAFRRWYTDARTTTLLRDIRGRTAGNSFESYVSYFPRNPPRP